MPENRKCRRTLRDEEAGLVFRWRIRGGSFRRTLVAAGATTVLFVLAGSILHLPGRTPQPVGRETSRVLVLPPETPAGREWFEWARHQSPFPDRWTVEVENVLHEQVRFFEAELVAGSGYEPGLRPIPPSHPEFPLPAVFELQEPPLPSILRPGPFVGPPAPVSASLVARPVGVLAERWDGARWPLGEVLEQADVADPGAVTRGLLGKTRRYLITAAPNGEVIFCQPMEESESELDRLAIPRLRLQQLRPAGDTQDLAGGFVEVMVLREEDRP